ncbi:mechanosensitive ion channel domain-containing protein [uncultured Serinicoccus sp.]|uniref:mechanosensitive ion channel family protein n=1 Tax=uncultured Serinicoccus sp. TaxID=735514 RepID=UPI00262A39CD|nr:mechanosensitive ion channel domain-containing protein [uncultured Serinicoccus sp.]
MSGADTGLALPAVTLTGAGLALATVVGAVLLGQLVRLGVTAVLGWRGRSAESARVFGRLAGMLVVALGVGAALTILFPSVRPVNILGGVGVISIAAGIAFQTVLGNMFAGIVILARGRFGVGDQIAVLEHAGTVVQMGLSSTSVRTFDGRLVLIPNGTLHSHPVTVQTGFEAVRSAITVELADDNDLEQVRDVAVRAMVELPTVLDEPLPQALFTTIGTRTVELELRFWSGARQLETTEARDAVIRAVLHTFRDAGIETSSDVTTIGVTSQLRELWERARGGDAPRAGSGSPTGDGGGIP